MLKGKPDALEFRELVFQVVRLIPYGRATSYGAIARAIGYPNLSRMVGRVLANSTAEGLPAHRVVNSQGQLSGRAAFETASQMEELLKEEGVDVENDRIKNWKNIFWDPISELGLE